MIWLIWSGLGLNTLAVVWCCRRIESACRAAESAAAVRAPAPRPGPELSVPLGRGDDLPRAVGLLLVRLGGRAEFTREEIEGLTDSDQIVWQHNHIADTVEMFYRPAGR